jgi:hypothetical protein
MGEVNMAASLERIRNSMDVKLTPENKGLILTLRLKAYDNGMIELDGIPINDRGKRAAHAGTPGPEYDEVIGWLGVSEVIGITLSEFHRQVAKRKKTSEREPV